jgi:hypothetical protein
LHARSRSEGQGIEEESDEIDGGAPAELTVDLEPGGNGG